jgi:hypothetical protein
MDAGGAAGNVAAPSAVTEAGPPVHFFALAAVLAMGVSG